MRWQSSRQARSTRPGFITLCGSSACLMARIMPSATGDLYFSSLSTLRAHISSRQKGCREPLVW